MKRLVGFVMVMGCTELPEEIRVRGTVSGIDVYEEGIWWDPVTVVEPDEGYLAVRMSNAAGEPVPVLESRGRTSAYPLPSRYDSAGDAADAWETATLDDAQEFDVARELVPGFAFTLDTFGAQDMVVFVEDVSIDVDRDDAQSVELVLGIRPIPGYP